MKKTTLLALTAVSCLIPVSLSAQNAVDALNLSQSELRGTARFMSMAGAFTALGGDLSTLNQNPAGIGIYRGSDFGLTMDLNMMSAKTSEGSAPFTSNHTRFDVNNAGYVGTYNIGDDIMQTFSWGFTYSRLMSFDRQYRGARMPMETSLTNYIALFTDGTDPARMSFDNNNNPYQDYSRDAPDWLSILSYSSGMINPVIDSKGKPTTTYNGLWQYQVNAGNGQQAIPATTGVADFRVREKGYMDEYSINFGGNLANTVYWGLGIGITDLNFEQRAEYGENLQGANVPNADGVGIQEGNADFELKNYKHITGTGVNVKFGLIFKPINEFRLGFAVHSPTWYNLTTDYDASTDWQYTGGFKDGHEYTDVASYDWKLRSPWKMMFGAAGVLGGRAIVSLDYEYQAYPDMKTQDADGDEYEGYTEDIKNYTQAQNTIRLGLEYRLTPSFSVRAGYAYSSANTKADVRDDQIEVVTSGTNCAYTVDKNTQYVTCGLGYRNKGFYADLAYVLKHRESKYNAFTPFTDYDNLWTLSPSCKVVNNNSQVVLTFGFKF